MPIPTEFDLDSAVIHSVNQAKRALGLDPRHDAPAEAMAAVATLAVPVLQAILEAERRRHILAQEAAADAEEHATVQMQESYTVSPASAITLWPDPDREY